VYSDMDVFNTYCCRHVESDLQLNRQLSQGICCDQLSAEMGQHCV
jgi:hypothetical protein